VELRAGAAVTEHDLEEHMGQRLAGYKLPTEVRIVDALPRTAATGQVQRTLIVERLQLG